jgi:hypothetical protein
MTVEEPETPIEELNRLTSDLVRLTSTDLSVTGDLTAPEFKVVLAAKRAELFAKQQEMEMAAENARKQMEAAQRAAQAAMAPLKKELARMAEGIWTVGLYLGVDETLVPLRGGTPAPFGTPLTVRQQVLAMDEESLIAAETGGIDVRDIEAFDEWILASPAHLEQVLPEQKGVVAILPSRKQRDYGNPWMTAAMNEANKQTWFLIRNGEKLYRLLADDFNVGPRLIPRSDEFTGYFKKDRWGHALQPGTSAWAEAEERAGAKQRHYMRVALILQGVIERTDAFAPLPEGFSLLSLDAYESGQVVTISDSEKVLLSSRQPFFEWLKERNTKLRPGMRIVGSFNGQEFRGESYHEQYFKHSRLRPETAEVPPSNTLLYVEQNAKKEMVCRYERVTESVWDSSTYNFRPAQQRASVMIKPSDKFIIPVDLVTIEEMEDYIGARSERGNYLTLVPLLRSAIAAKRAEHEEEAPFRRLIADTLSVSHGLELGEAEKAAEELVEWWKFANRHHRPLVNDDPELVSKAMRMITAEYVLREKAIAASKDSEGVVEQIRKINPGVMAVMRKRDGSVLAFVPSDLKYAFTEKNVFYTQYRFIKGELVLLKEWSVIAPHTLAKMQTLWSNDTWSGWNTARTVTDLLTEQEVEQAFALVSEGEGLTAVIHELPQYHYNSSGKNKGFDAFSYKGETGQDSNRWHGGPEGVIVEHDWIRFTRKSGNVEFEIKKMRPVVWTDGKAPWETEEGMTVFIDDAMVARVEADLKPLQEAEENRRRVSERSHSMTRSVISQWNRRAEEQAKQEHIAEYGSDDVWKQWLRSHPLPKCPVSPAGLDKVFIEYATANPNPTGQDLVVTDLYAGHEADSLAGITIKDS